MTHATAPDTFAQASVGTPTQPDAPVPVQSAADAAPPDADLIAVAGELRRLRLMHERAGAMEDLRLSRYHHGCAQAYAHALALLAGAAKPMTFDPTHNATGEQPKPTKPHAS